MVSLKCKEIFCLIYSGLLFISGIILITFSIILSYKIIYHFNFIPSSTIGPFIVIFILGFLHLFLTWLGIKGPTREHNFHIILFMIFTLILLICEFAVGIWTITLWTEVPLETYTLMAKSFNEMISFDKKEWSRLQSDLKCCGLNGFADYSAKEATPISCTNPDISNGTVQYIYENGCRKPLITYVKYILLDGALIGFISGIFQGIGIFVFYTYFKSLRHDRSERIERRAALQRETSIQGQRGQEATVPLQANAIPPVLTPPPPTTPPVTTSSIIPYTNSYPKNYVYYYFK